MWELRLPILWPRPSVLDLANSCAEPSNNFAAPVFLMTGSAGYVTVTIGPPNPAELSAHPLYIRAACAHTGARSRENFAFLKTILDQVQTLHVVAKEENRATFGADEIWRGTTASGWMEIGTSS
jgi:hypothetical protein